MSITLDVGSLLEPLARAAIIEAEWRRKSSALWEARRALDLAGAVDDRKQEFDAHIGEAERQIAEAVRAHRNALKLESQQ